MTSKLENLIESQTTEIYVGQNDISIFAIVI